MADKRRSPQVKPSSNPWLPMDILATDILPRLPARSLVQLKCVCKFFRTLISSSQFINLHFRFHPISSATNRILLFVSRNYNKDDGDGDGDGDGDDHEQDQRLYSVALDSQNKPRALNLPLPQTVCERIKYSKTYSIYAVGSCNGLVCLGFPWSDLSKGVREMCWGEYFMLLNPLTGSMFTSETLSFNRKGDRSARSITSFGFGFDRINGDYKLVAVTCFFCNYPSLGGRGGREVEIYSMKAHSWKCVEAATNQFWCLVSSTRGVLIHTHLLHWIYRHANYATYRIVSFNLETEQWGSHDVPFPPEIENCSNKTLGVLDGCLCLLLDIIPRQRNEVWVMKEYGVETSWMKLFSVTPWVPNTAFLYPCSKHRRTNKRKHSKRVLLNLDVEGEGCFWYNFKKKTINKFTFKGAPPSFRALTVCLESLVPLVGGSPIASC